MEATPQPPYPRDRRSLLPVLRPEPGAGAGAERRPRGAAGASDRGHLRDRNEDAFIIADLDRRVSVRAACIPGGGVAPEIVAHGGTLLVVADGLGGEAGGEIASAVAVDALVGFVVAALPWGAAGERGGRAEVIASLREATAHCERSVRRAATSLGSAYARMGTTLTAVLVLWPSAYVAHVGDSRCYLWRGGALRQLTRDHTLAQALVDRGVMEAPEGERSAFANVLVNAIGGGTDAADADCFAIDLADADELLLCTDGLSRYVTAEAIAGELGAAGRDGADPGGSCQRACERLIAAASRAAGTDNATSVVALL